MAEPHKMASGVQDLIARLKDEGVKAGRDEAERMVSEAQEKAAQIIAKAKTDADDLMNKTRAQLESEKEAAKESLRTAIRDTELMLESELKAGFADHVKRLVSVELKDTDVMKQLILAVAGRIGPSIPEGADIEMMVNKDQLDHLVMGISGDMLREGVEIKGAEDGQVGLRIRMVGENVEIDLSDNAISNVLLKYLLPRYRTIVAGVE